MLHFNISPAIIFLEACQISIDTLDFLKNLFKLLPVAMVGYFVVGPLQKCVGLFQINRGYGSERSYITGYP